MAETRLRVALDTNVLIAGVRFPRWPYEVMESAVQGRYEVLLPTQVQTEASRHLETAAQRRRLTDFLARCAYTEIPRPSPDHVNMNLDLIRDRSDVPLALALLNTQADILVTSDRDFTEPGATSQRFSEQVRVMLPAVFLRQIVGWSSESLEAIRHRRWDELQTETPEGDTAP
jgi:predicted nucleic acid-binding protein